MDVGAGGRACGGGGEASEDEVVVFVFLSFSWFARLDPRPFQIDATEKRRDGRLFWSANLHRRKAAVVRYLVERSAPSAKVVPGE
jgi:hypothetical protein